MLTGLAVVVVGEAVVGSAVVVVVGTSHCWVLCLGRGESDHSKAIKVVHVWWRLMQHHVIVNVQWFLNTCIYAHKPLALILKC